MDVSLGAWDLRHLLLSLEDKPRDERDAADLEGVVARAAGALAALPRRPAITVPAGPVLLQGLPLWIFETNAWLLAPRGAGGDCVIVDVPPAPAPLIGRVRRLGLRPVGIVITHAHPDHAGGVAAVLEALGPIPVHVHPDDRELILHPELDGVLARTSGDVRPPPAGALVDLFDGDEVAVGSLTLRSLHAPGHTAGSTCLMVEGAARPLLFTGDTLFAGGTGRCDQPGASRPRADASRREMLDSLHAETLVLPGHGGVTTVGAERDRHAVSDPTLAA